MPRLPRTLLPRVLAAAAIMLAAVLAVTLATSAGAPARPAAPAGPAAVPAGTAPQYGTAPQNGTSLPATSPTASKSPACRDCVTPQDAICWESVPVCPIPVVTAVPFPVDTTLPYRTVAGTAKPWVDYVPVDQGLLVIPAGKQEATVQIKLLPDPKLTAPCTFLVQFGKPSYGTLTREYAVVTVVPKDWKS